MNCQSETTASEILPLQLDPRKLGTSAMSNFAVEWMQVKVKSSIFKVACEKIKTCGRENSAKIKSFDRESFRPSEL